MSEQFSFLISSERSGSNLITKLLNAHSKICGPTTKHLLNPVYRNLFRYAPLENPKNWKELLDDIHNLLTVEFSVWKKSFKREDLYRYAGRGEIARLIKMIFLEEAQQHAKDFLFIKENHLYEFFPYLMRDFPSANYLYLIRDPRDMALSWKKSATHPGGVVNAAKRWKKDQQQSLKNSFILEEKGQVQRLHYEDLISSPEKELTRILNYFGFKFEPEMLEFHQNDLTRKNSMNQDAWSNLGKALIPDNCGKFRKELTQKEIEIIEQICCNEMNILGYSPLLKPNEWRITLSEIEVFGKKEENELQLNRPQGVLENMKAKKRFYQHMQ